MVMKWRSVAEAAGEIFGSLDNKIWLRDSLTDQSKEKLA